MRLDELDFDLPSAAIAQTPAEPRDSCRLMCLSANGQTKHKHFHELADTLEPGSVLVFNDSKVLPARVEARKPSGGLVELLFVRPREEIGGIDEGDCWEALVRPSRRLKPGSEVVVGGSERIVLLEELGEGRWAVRGSGRSSLTTLMDRHGRLPLPPYIDGYPEDPGTYQTVYAAAPGSAAAPTAGLHFTQGLMERLELKGVVSAWVTLHVGLDTFLPIREEVVEAHRIHTESYSVPAATLREVKAAKARGSRVVAVGTTAARVLETVGSQGMLTEDTRGLDLRGSTGIYIVPGHRFSVVDSLLTNFHLPRSTVLLLTMAFGGVDRIKKAYGEAVALGYRFFSFGDAMLVEPCDADCAAGGASIGAS